MTPRTLSAGACVLLLAAATLVCLVPFIAKPFHIDDPLFVWCARHIQAHPLDFYGFTVNWEGRDAPMSSVTQNPPLACYYLALVGSTLGWSEIALHCGALAPALAVVLGAYVLARRLCAHPLAAALATLTAPVFLLSASSVMCDTLMLAFWTWAVIFWMRGLDTGRALHLGLAALLASACLLTKYFGLSLVPLLLVYSLVLKRRPGRWACYLGIPLLAAAAYQFATRQMYGRGLLSSAAAYATNLRVGGALPAKLLVGTAFLGGCVVLLLTAAPALWSRRGLLAFGAGAVLLGLAAVLVRNFGALDLAQASAPEWSLALQLALLAAAGTTGLVLAAGELRRPTADGVLLVLWIGGTVVFASVVNWTVSGRNILPLLPAAAILIVRRLETRGALPAGEVLGRLRWPLGASLVIALSVAYADYQLADSARTAARSLNEILRPAPQTLWFQGHWGFQYYAEQRGAKALDADRIALAPGDLIIVPASNSFLFSLPEDRVALASTYHFAASTWLATMSGAVGAGYYSDGWGPLPFVLGGIPPDDYLVLRAR